MAIKFKAIPIAFAVTLLVTACQAPNDDTPTDGQMEADSTETTSTDVAAAVGTGEVCGGIAGTTCSAEGDFCKKDVGTCDIPDAQGVCTQKPEICPRDFRPSAVVTGKPIRTHAMPTGPV